MQLVVPSSMLKVVFEEIQSSVFEGGHTGIDKTNQEIEGMYKEVVNFVNHCELCKAKRIRKARIPMQDMPISELLISLK